MYRLSNTSIFTVLLTFGATMTGCDALKDALGDDAMVCADVCATVESCGATPPAPALDFGGMADGLPEIAALDCAANCMHPDKVLYGYSDCQIECVQGADCGDMNGCWDATSAVYAEYCLAGVEIEPLEVPPEEAPSNGTETGSSEADGIVDNPAVEKGVGDSEFDVNYGDQPPNIMGQWGVYGEIVDAMNARPIGSVIDTSICFWGQDSLTSTETYYCETGIPGSPVAPVTGTGNDFTIYLEYEGMAAILFSGTVDDPIEPTTITAAEAMVIYYHGIDIWELSETDWTWQAECSGC